MVAEPDGSRSLLKRKSTRRAFVGGSVAAASVAVAYAAGDRLGAFSSGGASHPATASIADTEAIKKESVKVSHLLRRAGFGVSRDEFDHYQSLGLTKTIDELVSYTTVNDDAAIDLANKVQESATNRASGVAWWLVRMANTKRPLQEKMTFFWHGLLTSQISVVRDQTAMIAQNEFFRSHAMYAFPAILKGVSQDPAMMVYLNVDGSQRGSPNENYARELMELFSLGVGNYSEQDVREAARAFTGWRIPRTRDAAMGFSLQKPEFAPQRFDAGAKSFLGRSGNFRPDDIVDIITDQPASATYITKRLFAFFIHPEPSKEELQPFVEVYNKNGRNIGTVVEAMLRSDVFYSPAAYRAVVKSPVEYAVGAIKALGLQESVAQSYTGRAPGPRGGGNAFTDMGQVPFEPPNVAGWPGNAAWLNSATIFARLNFVNQLTGGAGGPNRNGAPHTEPQIPADLGTAKDALDHYLPMVLDDNLPKDARQVMLDYAGGPDAKLSPEQLRGLVYLIFGSPQFHLA